MPKKFPHPQVLADVLARYRQHNAEDTLPRGGRGVFYDLRPSGLDTAAGLTYRKRASSEAGVRLADQGVITPEYVTEVVLSARRAGLLLEQWVSDARAPDPLTPSNEWDSAEQLATNAAHWLAVAKAARQAGQPVFLILWSEAGDLMPRIARIAGAYGVTVESGGGSDGLKIKRRIAEEAAERDVPTIVGHIGDYDKHGRQIFKALEEDCAGWLTRYVRPAGLAGASLEFERLALTEAQARDFDLLDADGKAEADGIPVPDLDALVRAFVDRHHDAAIRAAAVAGDPGLRAEAARLLVERFAS